MIIDKKDVLIKDLCYRLPYGVMISHRGLVRPLFSVSPTQHFQITLDAAIDGEHNGLVYVSLDDVADDVKPYLRHMDSMTDEEYDELCEYSKLNFIGESRKEVDWLNKYHFDYRELIERGLAIEVTEENNPYKLDCL